MATVKVEAPDYGTERMEEGHSTSDVQGETNSLMVIDNYTF